jgi:hypothetical protein
VLAAALFAPLGRFVEVSATWLEFPFPRSGTEGLILYESLLLKRGGDIYSPITPEQFISAPYPPLYYWLAATTLPDTLPDLSNPDGVQSIFRGGRLISLAAALLAAISIIVLVVYEGGYALKGRRLAISTALAGIVGGALFLTLPTTIVWATTFRSDMLMVGCTAAGLACIAAGASRLKPTEHATIVQNPMLLLGAVFFALAFFSKQTAIPGPMAAAGYLFLRDWRVGLRWCAAMAALVAVPFAVLDVITGHWFYLKMVDYHSLPLRPRTLTRLLQSAFWDDQWPLILVGLGYGVYRPAGLVRAWRVRTEWSVPMLTTMFVLASFAMLPSAAVAGADHNHLLLPGLAICVATGAALAWAFTNIEIAVYGVRRFVALVVIALLVGLYAAWTSEPSSEYNVNLQVAPPEQQEQLRLIALNVRQNPGTLFFSDSPGLLALAGKETPYDDPFTMNILAQQGRWDERVLRDMLRQGKMSLLVLSCDVINTSRTCQLNPGVVDAIRSGYQVIYKDILFTYAPK